MLLHCRCVLNQLTAPMFRVAGTQSMDAGHLPDWWLAGGAQAVLVVCLDPKSM